MIEARGLSKHSRTRSAAKSAPSTTSALPASRARFYGLLGANGAGKTTTLRMLARSSSPPTALHSLWLRRRRAAEKVRAKTVGFLSTDTALYPRLTAQEMVEYFWPPQWFRRTHPEKRVDDIFKPLDMNEFRDRRCDKLSTALKQKTSIARTSSMIHPS